MSNRLAQHWRARGPVERLSEAQLAATRGTAQVTPFGTELASPVAPPLALALLTQNAVLGQPLNPAIELAGRGYARAPIGPLAPGPARWANVLPILWPQARDDWGLAYFVAVLAVAGDDTVLLTAPVPAPPFAVVAEDQPRIPAGGLSIGGVAPNTPRPYGAGRYGESLYGGWPASGALFFAELDILEYAWATQPNECAPWADIVLVSGGCAP